MLPLLDGLQIGKRFANYSITVALRARTGIMGKYDYSESELEETDLAEFRDILSLNVGCFEACKRVSKTTESDFLIQRKTCPPIEV